MHPQQPFADCAVLPRQRSSLPNCGLLRSNNLNGGFTNGTDTLTELTDNPAVAGMPAPSRLPCRPWGAWITILWVVLAEGLRDAADVAIDHLPLHGAGQQSYGWHVAIVTISWAIPLVVLALAVRPTRCHVPEYFAWMRPRAIPVALGLIVVLAWELFGHALPYVLGGSVSATYPVEDYRALIGPGTPPWIYVLLYWPAAIYAPLVEETTYRGFLWRGLAASRLFHPRWEV